MFRQPRADLPNAENFIKSKTKITDAPEPSHDAPGDNSAHSLHRLVSRHSYLSSPMAMALGSLRYEALRKLNPRQFADLHRRNIAGENFDEMIDVLVLANEKGQRRVNR